MKEKGRLILWLIKINLFISTFTFGGGYVVVPMIKKYYVQQKQYFSEEECMEMAAIAQSSPGAIAVNLCILAGKRCAGWLGVLVTFICTLLPPILILSIISEGYVLFSTNPYIVAVLKGMEACVAALILDLIFDMTGLILKQKSKFMISLIPFAFIANCIFNINAIFILLTGSVLCLIALMIEKRKTMKEVQA